MEIKEIIIICVGNIKHTYDGDDIRYYDFDYNDRVLRIDFKNGSFVEYYKQNIICVKVMDF